MNAQTIGENLAARATSADPGNKWDDHLVVITALYWAPSFMQTFSKKSGASLIISANGATEKASLISLKDPNLAFS